MSEDDAVLIAGAAMWGVWMPRAGFLVLLVAYLGPLVLHIVQKGTP